MLQWSQRDLFDPFISNPTWTLGSKEDQRESITYLQAKTDMAFSWEPWVFLGIQTFLVDLLASPYEDVETLDI